MLYSTCKFFCILHTIYVPLYSTYNTVYIVYSTSNTIWTALSKYILKEFNGGIEFPLSAMAMKAHKMQEGDLVEFAGRVDGECIYLAISGVEFRASLN